MRGLIKMVEHMLNHDELKRYERQMQIGIFAEKAQVALKKSKVLVIGAGGLGSPILYYLVAAGIGTIGICDFDNVALNNLNRQILHFSSNIGQSKISSALQKLNDLNPHVIIHTHQLKVEQSNVEELMKDYDVIVDAVDNLESRLLITDACYILNKPCVEGAVVGMHGTLITILPHHGPCYRCIYPRVNEFNSYQSRSDWGILGVIAGTIGSLQANEVIKHCTNISDPIQGNMLIFDGVNLGFEFMRHDRNPHCPLCGENPRIKSIKDCGKRF